MELLENLEDSLSNFSSMIENSCNYLVDLVGAAYIFVFLFILFAYFICGLLISILRGQKETKAELIKLEALLLQKGELREDGHTCNERNQRD